MRTKKITVFVMLFTVLTLCLTLCSCSLFGGDNGGDDKKPTETPSAEEKNGWETLDSTRDVYQNLVVGCAGVAYQGSKESIRKKNNVLTADAKIKIKCDDTAVWLVLKAKYKTDSPKETTILSAEIFTDESAKPEFCSIAAYIYKNVIYVSAGNDNKISIDLPDTFWEQDFFPYEMNNPTGNAMLSTIAMGLATCVVTDSPTVGKYRRSTDEYSFSLDINLAESVYQLSEKLSTFVKDAKEAARLQKFIANIFGVEEIDVVKRNLPEGSMNLYFETKKGVISALSFDFIIKTSQSKNKLFQGHDLNVAVSAEKISFGNDYSAIAIPFAQTSHVAEREKFKSYKDGIYSVSIPLSEYNDTGSANTYTMRATTKMFQANDEDNFIFCEYLNGQDVMTRGVYFYDKKVYFYSSGYLCSFEIYNLGDLAMRVLTSDFAVLNGQNENIGLTETKKFDVYNALAYVIRSVTFKKSTLRFSITEDFFTNVFFDFDLFCKFGNLLTKQDTLKGTNGILELQDYIKTNQIIYNIDLGVSFLTTVNESSDIVKNVVAMLQEADKDAEKRLEKSDVELYLESLE